MKPGDTIEITYVGGWQFGLTRDQNLTPKAVEAGTIMLEHSIFNLPCVQSLDPKISVVVDVGAYIGDTALYFAQRARKVYAFEPQFDAYHVLSLNTMLSPNIIKYNLAAGDGRKVIANDNPLSGNLGTRTVTENPDGVTTCRIDELREFPDLVKIDCEGFEYNVLLGMQETMQERKPTIICEVYPEMLRAQGASKDDIYHILNEFGYRIEVAIGNESEPRWDIVATHESFR